MHSNTRISKPKERPVRIRGKRPILPAYVQAKMMRRLTEAARYVN
jgi:hypothetical protein